MAINGLYIVMSPAARRVVAHYLAAIAVGNLVWELLQLPLFALWQTETGAHVVFAALHCWVGDLLIASVSLAIGVLVAGRAWPQHSYARVAAITLLAGAAYTVFSEWLNVVVRGSWAYASAMPRVPPFGTGLSPLLQWIVVPFAAFAWARPRPQAARSGRSR
jgi:hypothetical protein